MKMNLKKVIALMLCVVMCGALFTACGSSDSDSSTIRIGGIGPLTGSNAQYGNAVKNAAELAVKEINEAGGINGVKLSFDMQDDESDTEKAVNAYNALKDWDMQISLGCVTTDPCKAIVPSTVEDNIFLLTPSASSEDILKDNDNCFQVCFTDPNQGTASAQYIAEHKLAQKIAVIYDNSNSYSTGIFNNFAKEAEAQGLEIVASEAFTADKKTDFSVQVSKAKSSGADLLFLPIYYTEASLILKECDAQGYTPTVFGCDGLDGLLSVENFDTSLAEGVILLTPFAADATDEATQKFVKAYKDAYDGETPNQFAADAYDAIYAIKAALEQSGRTVGTTAADSTGANDADLINGSTSASDICEALKAGITKIQFDGVTGEGMTWDANGAVSKEPKAMKIVDGAYTAM